MSARDVCGPPSMGTFRGNLISVGGAKAVTLGMPIAPLSEGSSKSWVQVIPGEGSFEGHSDGPFAFTADVVDTIVANASKRKTPIKFDYEHDTHNEKLGGPKPASGHVLNLERRDGDDGAELWAFVEWTERAAEMIRAREYNFNSPVIAFEWPDSETGEDQGPTLLSVGLTDVPFLDGQQAIQLRWKGKRMSAIDALRLSAVEALDRAKAKLGPDASTQDVLDAVYEQVDKQAQRDVVREVVAEVMGADMEEKIEMTTTEDPAEMVESEEEDTASLQDDAGMDGSAFLDALSEKTGLDRAAVLALLMDKLDTVAAAINEEADRDGMVSESRQLSEDKMIVENDALKAKVRKLTQVVEGLQQKESKRAKSEADAAAKAIAAEVDALISAGNIRDENRANAIRLFTQDAKAAREMFRDKLIPIGESQAGDSEHDAVGSLDMDALSPDVRALAQSFIAANVRGGNKQKCIALAIEKKGH